MQLILKATFTTKLRTQHFEQTLRNIDKRLRGNLRILEFRVDPDTYLGYIGLIASRQGNMADQYLAGLVGDPTYGGVPLRSDVDVDANCIELYHPNPVVHVDLDKVEDTNG